MNCAFCGGELKKTTVTFSHEEDETYILVKHVPAEVCPKAGERSISLKSWIPCCSLPNPVPAHYDESSFKVRKPDRASSRDPQGNRGQICLLWPQRLLPGPGVQTGRAVGRRYDGQFPFGARGYVAVSLSERGGGNERSGTIISLLSGFRLKTGFVSFIRVPAL